MLGRRRRSWLALVAASVLAAAAAACLVAFRGKLVMRSSDFVRSAGLLSTRERTTLKGALSAKGDSTTRFGARGNGSVKDRAVGRLQQLQTSKASSRGWSIEKMLKNGLDWDGKEGIKSGDDVIMVPPPLVVPKSPIKIRINGAKGGRQNEAGEKITQKVRYMHVQAAVRSVCSAKGAECDKPPPLRGASFGCPLVFACRPSWSQANQMALLISGLPILRC